MAWSRQAIFLRSMLTDRRMRFGVERGPSHALEILVSQAELGQDFLVRYDLSARVGGACLGDVAGLFLAHRLVVHRGVGQGDGDRIEHRFEQADDGGCLRGGYAIDEFVGLLLRVGYGLSHGKSFLSRVKRLPYRSDDQRRASCCRIMLSRTCWTTFLDSGSKRETASNWSLRASSGPRSSLSKSS